MYFQQWHNLATNRFSFSALFPCFTSLLYPRHNFGTSAPFKWSMVWFITGLKLLKSMRLNGLVARKGYLYWRLHIEHILYVSCYIAVPLPSVQGYPCLWSLSFLLHCAQKYLEPDLLWIWYFSRQPNLYPFFFNPILLIMPTWLPYKLSRWNED
jgi:hypothetical protein